MSDAGERAREIVNRWTEETIDDFTMSCVAGARLEDLTDRIAAALTALERDHEVTMEAYKRLGRDHVALKDKLTALETANSAIRASRDDWKRIAEAEQKLAEDRMAMITALETANAELRAEVARMKPIYDLYQRSIDAEVQS